MLPGIGPEQREIEQVSPPFSTKPKIANEVRVELVVFTNVKYKPAVISSPSIHVLQVSPVSKKASNTYKSFEVQSPLATKQSGSCTKGLAISNGDVGSQGACAKTFVQKLIEIKKAKSTFLFFTKSNLLAVVCIILKKKHVILYFLCRILFSIT